MWSSGAVALVGLMLGSGTNYGVRSRRNLVKEADVLTLDARWRFDDIRQQVATLEMAADDARRWLDSAAAAFEGSEYGTFWEAIDAASKALAAGRAAQASLAVDIDHYVTILQEREHDFPEWCADLSPIRDLTPSMARLVDLKKKADTHYEFASIRELRQISFEIVKGFANLTQAIHHLETSMVSAYRELAGAVERSALLRAASPAVLQVVAGVFFQHGGEIR